MFGSELFRLAALLVILVAILSQARAPFIDNSCGGSAGILPEERHKNRSANAAAHIAPKNSIIWTL